MNNTLPVRPVVAMSPSKSSAKRASKGRGKSAKKASTAKRALSKVASRAKKSSKTAVARSAKKAGARSAKQAAGPVKINPKADGDAPVKAYIAMLPAWQKDIASAIDDLVAREVPHVHRAIKWHTPFYGVPDQGWFASMAGFKHYVKVNFFKGSSLKPVPPTVGTAKEMRAVDIREGEYNEEQMAKWIRQAAAIPGWGA